MASVAELEDLAQSYHQERAWCWQEYRKHRKWMQKYERDAKRAAKNEKKTDARILNAKRRERLKGEA